MFGLDQHGWNWPVGHCSRRRYDGGRSAGCQQSADYVTGAGGSQLGAGVGGLGDWNGNGYDDILIAAPGLNGLDAAGNEVDLGGVVYLIDTDDINGATTVTDVALVTFYGEELEEVFNPSDGLEITMPTGFQMSFYLSQVLSQLMPSDSTIHFIQWH